MDRSSGYRDRFALSLGYENICKNHAVRHGISTALGLFVFPDIIR